MVRIMASTVICVKFFPKSLPGTITHWQTVQNWTESKKFGGSSSTARQHGQIWQDADLKCLSSQQDSTCCLSYIVICFHHLSYAYHPEKHSCSLLSWCTTRTTNALVQSIRRLEFDGPSHQKVTNRKPLTQ